MVLDEDSICLNWESTAKTDTQTNKQTRIKTPSDPKPGDQPDLFIPLALLPIHPSLPDPTKLRFSSRR